MAAQVHRGICLTSTPTLRSSAGCRGAVRMCVTKEAKGGDSRAAINNIVEALCRGALDMQDAVNSIHELCEPGQSAVPEARGVVRFLDARNTAAVHLASSLEALASTQRTAAAKNVPPEQYAAIRQVLQGVEYHAGAQVLLYTSDHPLPKPQRLPGTVAIISSAPRDNRAADECKIACQLMGAYAYRVNSLTTANLRQLMAAVQNLQAVDVLVVCSGTDSALPGMLAGMVDIPVIALPSATNPDGHDTLTGSLRGMTPGVAAVAGGDGVAAAAAAARVLRTAARYFDARVEQMANAAAKDAQRPLEDPANGSEQHRAAANNVSSMPAAAFLREGNGARKEEMMLSK